MKPKMGKICFRYFQTDEYVMTPQGAGIVVEDENEHTTALGLTCTNMNYHYTKDVVVSGTLGSIFLSVSWLTPNFLGFIFAPRS